MSKRTSRGRPAASPNLQPSNRDQPVPEPRRRGSPAATTPSPRRRTRRSSGPACPPSPAKATWVMRVAGLAAEEEQIARPRWHRATTASAFDLVRRVARAARRRARRRWSAPARSSPRPTASRRPTGMARRRSAPAPSAPAGCAARRRRYLARRRHRALDAARPRRPSGRRTPRRADGDPGAERQRAPVGRRSGSRRRGSTPPPPARHASATSSSVLDAVARVHPALVPVERRPGSGATRRRARRARRRSRPARAGSPARSAGVGWTTDGRDGRAGDDAGQEGFALRRRGRRARAAQAWHSVTPRKVQMRQMKVPQLAQG